MIARLDESLDSQEFQKDRLFVSHAFMAEALEAQGRGPDPMV